MNYFKICWLNRFGSAVFVYDDSSVLDWCGARFLSYIHGTSECTGRNHYAKAQALRLVDNYQNYPNESQDKQETYQLLLANNTLSNRQASNLIMEEFPRFNRTSEEIAKFSCNYGKPLYQIKPFTIYLAIAAK